MDEQITAKVSRLRNVNMFGELSHAHRVLVENASQQRPGYPYEAMSCIIVAAFKFEAFLNHIGMRMFTFWEQIDRLPHRNKLTIIATQLGVETDFGQRPFQTLTDLFKARDALAHGKPETLNEMQVVESGTREDLRRKKPLTKWEALCTVEFARRSFDDTERIAELLWITAKCDLDDLRGRGHSYSIEELK